MKHTASAAPLLPHCAFAFYHLRQPIFSVGSLFDKQKEGGIAVNIFHERNYRLTICASMLCKTYCFAFQKRLFCTVKA
ncbi:hypothetical protein CLI70_08225 [Prevotella intermedia]|nr:hypothetical protein CLI70_08225 [Prevotella intermedia]